MKSQKNKCVLCKKIYTGYGNNAEPLAKGECCDKCNIGVIMARLFKRNLILNKVERRLR